MKRAVPLRRRLFWLVAAAIVPVALASGIALLALADEQRERANRTALEIARALSTAVDAELQRSISVLEALASASLLDTGDLERYHLVIRRVAATRPQWLSMVLHDARGNMLLNTRLPFGAAMPQTAEKESIALVMERRAPVVGYLALGALGSHNIAVRVPVVRNGELRYVLSAVVKPDAILEIVMRQRLASDWVVSVFDGKNKRVARSRQHAQYIATEPAPSLAALMAGGAAEGTGTTYALEGDPIYTAYSRSPSSGWTVAVGIPLEAVQAGTRRSVAAYGGGILLSMLFGVLAAMLIGHRITAPIRQLGAAAKALGRRERLELPQTPIAEIRQVADSLATASDERARAEAEREQLLLRERAARAIAEEANRSKDEFLAMLGHELRNPLGAISNASLLLAADNEEGRAHARAVISRQVQHLARMTDDLLDAARAMTGKIVLQRQPLDLAEAATHALSALRTSGRAGGRHLVQRTNAVWVDADPTRIEQILGNLLGNAVKFTPDDAVITLSVGREGAEAVLRVADTGIGMSRDLAARAFDPFVQGERPLDRSQGGLGIGLTLVKRLAELHGGSVSAESDGPGRGSVFTVRLPAAEPARLVRAQTAARELKQPRDILIVEDNDDARETLRRMLELGGHRVRVAGDGPSGLEAVRASMPDIALIDIGLPHMDGYELARRIRSLEDARRPYLVAVTGYGLPNDRAKSRSAGFDLHLTKPVDAEDLAEVLSR